MLLRNLFVIENFGEKRVFVEFERRPTEKSTTIFSFILIKIKSFRPCNFNFKYFHLFNNSLNVGNIYLLESFIHHVPCCLTLILAQIFFFILHNRQSITSYIFCSNENNHASNDEKTKENMTFLDFYSKTDF